MTSAAPFGNKFEADDEGGRDPIDDRPDDDSVVEPPEPSKESSAMFCAGKGARNKDADEFCLERIAEELDLTGEDEET